MAIFRLVTAVKNACLGPIRDAIDAGSGAGTIKIYTGTIPASPADAVGSAGTNTLLGTLTFSDPCTASPGSLTGGVLTMGAITQDSSADATGVATWARIQDSTGATVGDIDVSNSGGGGTLQLNTISIVAGGPILITAFTITA